MGYLRISMQIYQAFGITISPFAVGRILRKHFKNSYPKGSGPSWLTFIGHMKDSLWSVDLFYSICCLTRFTVPILPKHHVPLVSETDTPIASYSPSPSKAGGSISFVPAFTFNSYSVHNKKPAETRSGGR
jgi:hypothetical protein